VTAPQWKNGPGRSGSKQGPGETGDPIADGRAVIAWAHQEFGSALCLTASFGDATLSHFANSVVPGIEITLLDTGYLFAETDWYMDQLQGQYDLNVRVMRPDPKLERDVWQTDTEACCNARKVEPLTRALSDKSAWVTGLRRSDSVARRSTPLVHSDLLKGVTKINPLAAWTDQHVEDYAAQHGLPDHPLADRDYTSIGCWPCTRASSSGEDGRSGRWVGSEKTECGLHL
jgi:phosphoadenosine phosphosulfate reductase